MSKVVALRDTHYKNEFLLPIAGGGNLILTYDPQEGVWSYLLGILPFKRMAGITSYEPLYEVVKTD